MPRVKVKVERGNGLQQVITVDTDATKGARLGSDLYMPSGQIATPESVRQWLGLGVEGGSGAFRPGYGTVFSGGSPKTISVDRTAAFAWTGQHSWEKALWVPDGTAALPGVAFGLDHEDGLYRIGTNNLGVSTDGVLRWDINTARTFQSLPFYMQLPVAASSEETFVKLQTSLPSANPAAFVVSAFRGLVSDPVAENGWQIGIWEGGTAGVYAPTAAASGYRVRFMGDRNAASSPAIDRQALIFYGHNNSAAGVEVFRLNYVSAPGQLLLAGGAVGGPGLSFRDYPTSGIYVDGNSNVRFAVSGAEKFQVAIGAIYPFVPIHFAQDGSAGAPALSWNSDPDIGLYRVGTNTLGISTNGNLRFQFGAAGQFGIGGATYGTANTQAIVSGGASAAPSWQTVLVDAQTQTLSGDKTWSGQHTWSGTRPRFEDTTAAGFRINQTGAAANEKKWEITAFGGNFLIASQDDADTTNRFALDINRNGVAIASMTYGNSTDLSPHEFYGPLKLLTSNASIEHNVTSAHWWRVVTTGADAIYGSEASAGGSIFAGSSAYAAVFGSYANRDAQIISNATVRLTATAAGGILVNAGLQNFVDDAAAAAGGIAVNQLYRNGSVVMIRVS